MENNGDSGPSDFQKIKFMEKIKRKMKICGLKLFSNIESEYMNKNEN